MSLLGRLALGILLAGIQLSGLSSGPGKSTPLPGENGTESPRFFRNFHEQGSKLLELRENGRYRLLDRDHKTVREADRGTWMAASGGDWILTSERYYRKISAGPFTGWPLTTGTLDSLTSLGLGLEQVLAECRETTIPASEFERRVRKQESRNSVRVSIDPKRLYQSPYGSAFVTREEVQELVKAVDEARTSPTRVTVRVRPAVSRDVTYLEVDREADPPWQPMTTEWAHARMEKARDRQRPRHVFAEISEKSFKREEATPQEYLFVPDPAKGLPEETTGGTGRLTPDPAKDPLGALRSEVPGLEALVTSSAAEIAGHYADPGPTLKSGLSGRNLYLFPDSTFLYLEWADIMPLTIRSQGRWQVTNGFVTLEDDGTTTDGGRVHLRDDILLPIRFRREFREETSETVCLLGFPESYEYFFSAEMLGNRSMSLIIVSLERVSGIRPEETEKLKKELQERSRKGWAR